MAIGGRAHGHRAPRPRARLRADPLARGRSAISARCAPAINCALANRQILTHLRAQASRACCRGAAARSLYDVSHNTCKVETHVVDGRERVLFVHRKGATRAFGPGHPDVPAALPRDSASRC